MNLVNPAGLWLAALAAPIIGLYILKIRLRRVPVSTIQFWRRIYEEKKPRSIWQRLRHWLSLALQLAFLSLLVAALADPIFRWQQGQGRRRVLVLDDSASMSATDVAPSRFESARAACRRIIDGMRLGDETAIIAAGTHPRVLCGMTDHQRTLRDALDAAAPADGPTRVPDAVALARRLLAGPTAGRGVVVVSDGGFEGAAELSHQADVEMIPVGGPAANLGITRLQARRSLLDPIGYEILVEVFNASNEAAECRLELDLNDEPVDVVPLGLKPGERTVQVFEKASADGGLLRARVDHGGALASDDSAMALLPKRGRRKVRLVTDGDLFLEKVFEAMPLVDLEVVKDPAAKPPAGPPPALTVFDGKTPDALPPGPILVVAPGSSNALWRVADRLLDPVVAKQDGDSMLMTHIRLDRVLMPEARKLVLDPGAKPKVLAETAGGDPLYAILERPEGPVVVLTVDLDKSDLPLQTAFPIMTTNLLSWLSGAKGELQEAASAGSTTQATLPAEADPRASRVLRPPSGADRPLPPGAVSIGLGPLDRVGIWKVVRITPPPDGSAKAAPAEETLTEIACNLGDRRETDLRPSEGLEARAEPALAGFFRRPLWFYLVACAWLLTSWEWFLHQRRWID
jgi:hypothetical protein